MINASERFKTAMRRPVKMIGMYLTEVNGDHRVFRASDSLVSVEIETIGSLFSTAAKAIVIRLIGTDVNLVDSDIRPTLQAQISTNPSEWNEIDYGIFRINEQEVDLKTGTTTCRGYDMIGAAADLPYVVSDIEWKCTVGSLAEQVAKRIGVELGTDMSTLANYDYLIEEDLYEKISETNYRNILAEIAGATGTTCRMHDDKLEFIKPPITKAIDVLSYDNLLDIKRLPLYGPINSVVLARTPQEDNIVLSDDESIANNGLTELKLANNEILDDARERLAPAILDTVKNFAFTPIDATTEGHGWYEFGDRILVTDGENDWESVITEIKLVFSGGGIKEVIKAVTPDETQTNYALAGGITKTLYNTEIKVDKQNQRIDSIVEEQQIFEGEVNNNFTQINQNISSVITSVQSSGGNNLIRNSAFYFKDADGSYTFWTLSDDGKIEVLPSAEAASFGSLSGQVIRLKNKSIAQTVSVKADSADIAEDNKTYYTFSCRIRKTAAGEGSIIITDGYSDWKIEVPNGEAPIYNEYTIEKILPKSSVLVITVFGSDESELSVTDMMLAVGDYRSQWTQANGELANTQTQVDIQGVKVSSTTTDDTSSQLTSQGLYTKDGSNIISSLTNGGLVTPEINATREISMPPIKIVPQRNGWAFVPTD